MEITQKPFSFQLKNCTTYYADQQALLKLLEWSKNNSDKWKEETNVSSSPKWLNLKVYIRSLIILIIHGFHILKFTYLLKRTWHSKVNTQPLSVHRVMKSVMPSADTLSWGLIGRCSAFLSQHLHRKQVSFLWSIQCHIFHISYFLLVILPFKMAFRLMLNSYLVFLSIG